MPSFSSVTYAWRPLGSTEMLVGAFPVGISAMTRLSAVSITVTVLSKLFTVKRWRPSGEYAMSSGFLPTGICLTIWSVAVLIRKTCVTVVARDRQAAAVGREGFAVRGLANLDLFDDAVVAGI